MEFLIEYGLFLAKSLTVLVSILVVIVVIFGSTQRQRDPEVGHIEVKNLNDSLEGVTPVSYTHLTLPTIYSV